MDREIPLPDGRVVVYHGVPEGVSDEAIKAKLKEDFPDAFRPRENQTMDIVKSLRGGAVKGVVGALDLPRKIGGGLAMPIADALASGGSPRFPFPPIPGLKGAAEKMAGGYSQQQELIDKGVSALGGDYQSQTAAGEYSQAGAEGATSALSPNKGPLAVGAITGIGSHIAEKIGGPVAKMAAALGIPLGTALGKHALFPRLGYDETQAAMGVVPRSPMSMEFSGTPGKEAALASVGEARQVAANAAKNSVDLLPAQAVQQPFASKHPLVGLQERTAATPAGAAILQPALAKQAGQAEILWDKIISTAKESGKYTRDLEDAKALYEAGKKDPLILPRMVPVIVGALKDSTFYKTVGVDQRKYLDNVINLLENQGKNVIPGKPEVTMRTLVEGEKGTKVLQKAVPATSTPVPVQTQGQMLDVRGQAAKGFDNQQPVGQAVRAEARTALNAGLGPKTLIADALHGPATEKEKLVSALTDARAKAFGSGAPDTAPARAANEVFGHPASTQRQAFGEMTANAPFEQSGTPEKLAELLTLATRTGAGRGTVGELVPSTYGQAKAAGASVGTSAVGTSGPRSLLSVVPFIRQKLVEVEARRISEALADKTGKKLAEFIKYDPNNELLQDLLRSAAIASGTGGQ